MTMAREIMVSAINRFPVKSMAGQQLQEAECGWHGLVGDRRYAFIKARDRSKFPYLTARTLFDLLRYEPSYTNSHPYDSPIHIRTPTGNQWPLASPELLAELETRSGEALYLLQTGQGFFDSMGISILSTATVHALGLLVGRELDQRRFRANIIVDAGDTPFVEETWLGATLRLGAGADAPAVKLNRGIPRCAMINLDPDSAERDASVLKTVVRERENIVGMYGMVVRTGTVQVGDNVEVIPGHPDNMIGGI